MLFFVVDEDGSEWVYDDPPIKDEKSGIWTGKNNEVNFIHLPTGSTKKICGWETSWDGGFITKKNELDYQ